MHGLNTIAWSFWRRSIVDAVVYYPDPSSGLRHFFPQQLRELPAAGSQMSPTLRIATRQMGLLQPKLSPHFKGSPQPLLGLSGCTNFNSLLHSIQNNSKGPFELQN